MWGYSTRAACARSKLRIPTAGTAQSPSAPNGQAVPFRPHVEGFGGGLSGIRTGVWRMSPMRGLEPPVVSWWCADLVDSRTHGRAYSGRIESQSGVIFEPLPQFVGRFNDVWITCQVGMALCSRVRSRQSSVFRNDPARPGIARISSKHPIGIHSEEVPDGPEPCSLPMPLQPFKDGIEDRHGRNDLQIAFTETNDVLLFHIRVANAPSTDRAANGIAGTCGAENSETAIQGNHWTLQAACRSDKSIRSERTPPGRACWAPCRAR
jgi:hypothetical protein